VHFVCVGTPQAQDSPAADLTYVDQVVTSLARHLHRRRLVVGKSIVPVGTAARLTRLLLPPRPLAPRSSCAKASPSRTRCVLTGWSSAWSRSGPAPIEAAFAPQLADGVPLGCSRSATSCSVVSLAALRCSLVVPLTAGVDARSQLASLRYARSDMGQGESNG
jgi:UDPglucose 6-dehydrogenase